VTMCRSVSPRVAPRVSSMKPAMTDRAAFPVHSTNNSVTGGPEGDGGQHGPGEVRGKSLPAAADVDNGSGHVRRRVAAQPLDGRRHLFGVTNPLHRDLGAQAIEPIRLPT
jgi:hypothetical protein